jgi:hypothetical protein
MAPAMEPEEGPSLLPPTDIDSSDDEDDAPLQYTTISHNDL